jgi:lipopolysaccharide biosynthesis regulator YciM
MCNTERTVISKENKIDTERDDKGFSCHACEFKLSSFVATCPNCS